MLDFNPLERTAGAVRLFPVAFQDTDVPLELLPRIDAMASVVGNGNRQELRMILGGSSSDVSPAATAEAQVRARQADVDAATDTAWRKTAEFAAKETAAEELAIARAELAKARQQYRDAEEAFQVALEDYQDPRPLRATIDSSEKAAADCAAWVERLQQRFAAASLASGQARARIWACEAAQQRGELVARHAALASQVAEFAKSVASELLLLGGLQAAFAK